MPTPDKQLVAVRLPQNLVDELSEEASSLDLTKSAYIRMLLRRGVQKRSAVPDEKLPRVVVSVPRKLGQVQAGMVRARLRRTHRVDALILDDGAKLEWLAGVPIIRMERAATSRWKEKFLERWHECGWYDDQPLILRSDLSIMQVPPPLEPETGGTE